MLQDGTYDVLVIEAEDVEGDGPGAVRVEVTITSGPAKGDVVAVRGRVTAGDALDLLGVPATLVVEHGEPHLRLDGSP